VGYPTIPTIESGLAGLERRVASVLDKVNELPIEDTLDGATQVLAELNAVLGSDEVQALPVSLEETLAGLRDLLGSVSAESRMQEQLLRTITQLDRTLESLREVLEALEDQPSALIFNREPADDLRPPAGSP
jgi:paraquat-inducible protein B